MAKCLQLVDWGVRNSSFHCTILSGSLYLISIIMSFKGKNLEGEAVVASRLAKEGRELGQCEGL